MQLSNNQARGVRAAYALRCLFPEKRVYGRAATPEGLQARGARIGGNGLGGCSRLAWVCWCSGARTPSRQLGPERRLTCRKRHKSKSSPCLRRRPSIQPEKAPGFTPRTFVRVASSSVRRSRGLKAKAPYAASRRDKAKVWRSPPHSSSCLSMVAAYCRFKASNARVCDVGARMVPAGTGSAFTTAPRGL